MRAFFRSFVYAGQGIAYVVRTQRNAKIHFAIACLAVAGALYFHVSSVEWAVLVLTIGVVFASEMFNTVAELAIDVLVQRYHPLAKIAKDAAAGGVLIVALAAIGVGIAIFGPRLWNLLFGA